MKKIVPSNLVWISLIFHKIESSASLPVLTFEKCTSNEVLGTTKGSQVQIVT